jgi:PAS domain S-box-containing protein
MYGFQTLLAYHFEDIPNALIYADAQLPYEYAAKGGYAIARMWLFDALTRLAAYPASDNRVKQQLRNRIDAVHRQLGKRARLMPANFQHQFDLVGAEKCRVAAEFTQAIELYDRAIAGARANKYLQEEALANELAAKFYLGWGKAKIAATYMQEAYYAYVRWGAKAKTQDLEQRYPSLLAPIFQARQLEFNSLSTLAKIANPDPQDVGVDDVTNLDVDVDLDLASVIQSAQALSGTIELADLIQQLSQIILKHAGAQTCIIALPDRDDEWQLRSISTLKGAQIVTTQLQQPLADSSEYPANSIYWVKNTRQTIAGDARQLLAVPDLYLLDRQPQSVFCLPIVDRSTVLGVLYLEHRHAPDMFADSKKTVISFLCTQAAIALANARLYQDVQASTANLQLQQSYLTALLDNIPHIAWLKDRDARFIAVNQSFGELVGCACSELIGKNDLDYWPSELAQKYQADDSIVMASGKRQVVEEQIVNAGGEVRSIETIRTPIRGNQGTIVGTAGIAVDITDRKAMEIALRESEQRYHQLISNVLGALYQFELAADGTPNLNYISARCTELFELSPPAAMADISSLLAQIFPEDRRSFDRSIRQAAKFGNYWSWEGRIKTPSGQIEWIRGESRQTATTDGSIAWDGILMDITTQQAASHERQQAEIELHQSNERLEATIQALQHATRLKDEFLATMSHELRTPLNAILGMSEALEEQIFGDLNPRQLSSIATIAKSGEHLLSLINDLLDVSKIAAGKLELNLTQVSLAELCKSSLLLVRQQAINKQIHLDSHLPVDIDRIAIDERRMRQVLLNLLNNAIKFTNTGGRVRLAVWLATDAKRAACLCFAITDTGIGISEADRSKLFQPFVQIDSRLSRKYTGTGLGLVLAKQIVELHGGRIVVESEIGFGSCFTVEIPQPDLAVAAADRGWTLARSSHTLPPALSILLVEDNAVTIDTFTSYLQAKGYRTIVAHSGQQAISLAQSHHPDLILIDLHMSEDSIPTIEWLRHHSTQVYIPIIALATAVATTSDREQWLAAGVDKYLAKPVKLCELHHTIQECLDLN